ncbi:MAG: glutamine amidotransferase [Eubacteriales bacterium]|nr:glutamine amidotransferase [Eubacteriales bacterium]
MYEIKICHLYPDLLNLYGDTGNIISLRMRSVWRGIGVSVLEAGIGSFFDPCGYDIVFIGGGQDLDQAALQNDLLKNKKSAIFEAVESNRIFLCICGGFQLMGKYYKTGEGRTIDCLGIMDHWTEAGKNRFTGNYSFECDFLKKGSFDGRVAGFENHSGRTFLSGNAKPLGRIIRGSGNNGEDGYEGAIYRNVYCSYSHGSLLPKNPAFADHLLALALTNKYPDFEGLEPLDDTLENIARLKAL